MIHLRLKFQRAPSVKPSNFANQHHNTMPKSMIETLKAAIKSERGAFGRPFAKL